MRQPPLLLPAVVFLAALPSGLPAVQEVSFFELAKLTAADGAPDDNFGISVAVSGDTAVVGTWQDDDLGVDSGSAYIFQRDVGGVEAWVEVAKLTAADGAPEDNFGISVAVSGDTAVVGARRDDDLGIDSGSAYIFRRGAGGPEAWGQVAKLTAADGSDDDSFGYSVAISGDTVIVGSYLDDGMQLDAGSAYIFRRDAGGLDAWGQVVKLTATDGAAGDNLGFSVALRSDTAVVGAWRDDDKGLDSGSAYIFRRDAGGADGWGEVAKLTASGASARDNFGFSVTLSRDTAVVGAPLDDAPKTDSGSAWVFRRDAGGPEAWGQVAKLTAADGAALAAFGDSVALSGDTAVVGSPVDSAPKTYSGSAYVFRRDAGGQEAWGQLAKLAAADDAAADQFGMSVGLSGGTILVGAWFDDDLGTDAGAAYIFRETLVDPGLAISGTCPGEITLTGSGLTPNGGLQLYSALAEGTDRINRGPCIGTLLDLNPARAFRMARADADGRASLTRSVSEAGCGLYLQLVDLTSCAVSNVVQLP